MGVIGNSLQLIAVYTCAEESIYRVTQDRREVYAENNGNIRAKMVRDDANTRQKTTRMRKNKEKNDANTHALTHSGES